VEGAAFQNDSEGCAPNAGLFILGILRAEKYQPPRKPNLDPPDFQATPSELLQGANFFRAGVRFGTRIIT